MIEETSEIISFLKKYNENYEKELFTIMDNSNQGIYIIDDDKITLSSKAKKLLNVDEPISLNYFYNQINLQDRNNFLKLLSSKKNDETPYEITYRYKTQDDKVIWIKEHGIFSYDNKNKRLAIINDYTRQVKQDTELHRLAFYDKTTDLKNNNFFEQDINFLHKYKIPFALFLVDINSFKLINDNLGHMLGDLVLRQFSQQLKLSIKSNENNDVYRLSGDEFAIIFPYINRKKDTEKIIDNIMETFSKPLSIDKYKLILTPSVGISFYPRDTRSMHNLLKFAELCMHKAKSENFIHYSYFDKQFYNLFKEEKAIEGIIKYNLDNNLFGLNYQAIYDYYNNKVVGYEALFNSNSQFNSEQIFGVALKSHLIVDLERYIIEKIFQEIESNQQNIKEDIRFSINITPKTIQSIDLYEELSMLLKKYQVRPEQIALEITEQYFIADEAKLNILIFRLQSLGIKIYLDDFGMGYSSVRNVTYMSYDSIKLDKRLIQSIFTNKKVEYFIKSIIQFSKDINCTLIFEGVETKEQIDYFLNLGAGYFQGYYYSKPAHITEALRLLKKVIN